jgi:hypothetical protein
MIRTKLAKIISSVAVAASTMLVAAPSHAGLVWFSRANCINNESISWDWPGRNHTMWTNSFHWDGAVGWEPTIRTGWATGYRSAAVHWGEGRKGNYYVIGSHFDWDKVYGEHFLGYTPTTGCNLSFFFPYW